MTQNDELNIGCEYRSDGTVVHKKGLYKTFKYFILHELFVNDRAASSMSLGPYHFPMNPNAEKCLRADWPPEGAGSIIKEMLAPLSIEVHQ